MDQTNRRYFLMTSLAMTASSLAHSPVSTQANDRIRIAVVGLRSRGRNHIQAFHDLRNHNVEVAALCDIDENILSERLIETEKLTGKRPETFTDMRDLMDKKDIDVISFATPNHWHALGTIWACQAGKDVYIEKPTSHGIWEGRKMVEAARKYHRIVQCGTQIISSFAIQ